jgi:hypothetical protein
VSDNEAVARACYAAWARRMDILHPTLDRHAQRGVTRPRPRWERLEPPMQDVWLRVAEVALERVAVAP